MGLFGRQLLGGAASGWHYARACRQPYRLVCGGVSEAKEGTTDAPPYTLAQTHPLTLKTHNPPSPPHTHAQGIAQFKRATLTHTQGPWLRRRRRRG